MKLALLSLRTINQFVGLDQEDHLNHLATLYELCETLGTNYDDGDVIHPKLFPFSLTGKARIWLQSHPN